MNWTGCKQVEAFPGKVSGVPLIRGSRVQADTVLESYQLGESVEQIADSFDLSVESVRSVLAFAHEAGPVRLAS